LKNKFTNFALLIYGLFTFIPLLTSFGYATLYSFGLAGILRSGFTFSNWVNTVSAIEVISSFAFSFYIATASIVLAISLALFWAAIFRKELHHRWASIVFYLPLGIPAIVAAFFTFQIFSKSGLLSRILFHSGFITDLQQFPDLIHDEFGIGIIATHVMMAVPFFTILFTNLTESENLDELRRLARTLGASFTQTEFRIAIPILLRKAFSVITLYFIFVLGSYEIPLLLGRQNPQMISVLVIRKLQRFNLLDIPTAYTMAVLYLIVAGFLIILLFRKQKLAYDL
jgi:putative spermidine/putrescine transport system permease protein